MNSDAVRAAIEAAPYAAALDIAGEFLDGALMTRIAFREDLVGNTRLPALHGGLIGAFMELTALAALRLAGVEAPRTIGVTVEYLRPGRPKETFAQAQFKRLGKRIANVHVEAWQDESRTPIALLQGRFLVGEASDA